MDVSAFCSAQIFGFVFGKVFNSKPTIHYTIDVSFSNNCSAHLLGETSLNGLFAGEWDSKTLKNRDFGPPQAKKYRNFGDFVSKKMGILTMLVINPPLVSQHLKTRGGVKIKIRTDPLLVLRSNSVESSRRD